MECNELFNDSSLFKIKNDKFKKSHEIIVIKIEESLNLVVKFKL
jgi:hypothetical protein